MVRYTEDSLLPLSGLQHYAFCPRRWALIHIERQWSENLRTVEGHHLHEKVHSGPHSESIGEVIIARSIPIVSYELGLYGVADLIEYHRATDKGVVLTDRDGVWQPHPVEYKRGKAKSDDRDEVQLCAQAICLEEMLETEVNAGSLFYGQPRRRTRVSFTPELRERVAILAREMHEIFERGTTPFAPAGVPCNLCSLKDVCVPKLTRRRRTVKTYLRTHLDIEHTR